MVTLSLTIGMLFKRVQLLFHAVKVDVVVCVLRGALRYGCLN